MSSLKRLIKKVDRISKKHTKSGATLDEILEHAKAMLLEELDNIPDHHLRSYGILNVDAYVDGKGRGILEMKAPHAKYVEFGTGVVNPPDHPLAEEIENYKKGGTGKTRMAFLKDGKYYSTVGMGSRPYLYNTMMRLEAEYGKSIEVRFRYD